MADAFPSSSITVTIWAWRSGLQAWKQQSSVSTKAVTQRTQHDFPVVYYCTSRSTVQMLMKSEVKTVSCWIFSRDIQDPAVLPSTATQGLFVHDPSWLCVMKGPSINYRLKILIQKQHRFQLFSMLYDLTSPNQCGIILLHSYLFFYFGFEALLQFLNMIIDINFIWKTLIFFNSFCIIWPRYSKQMLNYIAALMNEDTVLHFRFEVLLEFFILFFILIFIWKFFNLRFTSARGKIVTL